MKTIYFPYLATTCVSLLLAAVQAPSGGSQGAASGPRAGGSEIGGVVTSANGPEAGVWVIAETNDLPTKFTKIVVTDDGGRYVIPELPKANYSVWVRGYGLIDSPKVQAAPGKPLDLKAVPAPNEAAAAQYYPGMYWYSMLHIPAADQFPGTGAKGNGIPEIMKAQHYWVDTVKNACQSCHAFGTHGIRVIPPQLGEFKDSKDAWAVRTQSGQAQGPMAARLVLLGPDKGIALFADWTDRVAKGELP